ncbi:hypothetical protein EVJ58_g10631 [Rhodofomes roseus]|uniref:Reverse transcriptase domain-containing protein n=1 Tax=Rhodofomes roseus TaxID=34475 RepID=A0A4Y9XMK6_9APHY|nr:hypothetical protein EVJ58_g10631 [Rhodofomes roseus]
MKNKSPKLEAAIRKLTKEVDRIQALPSYITDHKLLTDTEVLLDRIVQLEKKRYQYIRDATTARYALNAETITKYWSSINREKRPRDVIYSLKKPSDQEYTTRSDDMAELTRNYHNDLQQQDVEKTISDTRCTSITRAKDALETKLDTSDANGLKEAITANDIAYALKKAQSGKASGLDGIPYELWQTLYNGKVQDEDEDTDFNGIDLLKLVYNDIRLFGVVEETDFADGWMCPIYKKQDRRDVSNYRPITVLNTDYKLYTRILTSRLASVVKKIVHPNQAGFIPGRHITDHTQTCKTLVDFAEATEVNGVIVALDQEKAYDKIRHDYLWEILEAAGIPKSFIDQIKSLYKHAKTIVIINGESSSPFNPAPYANQN